MHIEVDRTQHSMRIRLPKFIFYKELLDARNPLERVMLSQDRRLILCGKVVIQMNKNEDDVKDIGCFYTQKESSIISYKFYSLLDLVQRKFIGHKLHHGDQ